MVKQVRVLRNVAVIACLAALLLWWARDALFVHWGQAGLGGALGAAYGAVYWRLLSRRIERIHHRFARNKIFVRFISLFELALTALASSLYVLMAIGGVFAIGLLFDWFGDHRWSVLLGTFGLGAALVLAGLVMRYERRHGALHYQYASDTWSGAEGMLYQQGTVIRTLDPAGRAWVNGESWQAVSVDGERIEEGQRVEVLSVDGLTVFVDRVPAAPHAR